MPGAAQNPSISPPPWRTAAFLVPGLAVGLILVGRHVLLDATRTWDYNVVRLQRSFVLAAGGELYPGADSGAVLNTIYGPVGALAYLPATWFQTPAAAVLAGQLLALAFVLIPPLALHARTIGRGPGAGLGAVFGALLFIAFILDLRPLEYVAFTVHVDAPALALALSAWAVATGGEGAARWAWPRLILAAGLAGLAVWTKLMTLPLLATLPLWGLLVGGWRAALRWSAAVALASATITGAVVAAFGPAGQVFFNVWTVPSRHTADRALELAAWLGTLGRFLHTTLEIWLVAALVLLLRWVSRRREAAPRRAAWTRDPLRVYGLPALALLPLGLFGLLKRGGDVNALSYSVYFLTIGLTLALATEAGKTVWGRRLALGLPVWIVATLLFVQAPESLTSWRQPLDRAALPHQIAYEYARAHPGRMYFPRITLASLLAEGRIYHQSVGLLDRVLAGVPPDRDHLLAHLPPDLEGIAFDDNPFRTEMQFIELSEFSCPGSEPELPGFVVYRRCRSSP